MMLEGVISYMVILNGGWKSMERGEGKRLLNKETLVQRREIKKTTVGEQVLTLSLTPHSQWMLMRSHVCPKISGKNW